MTKTTTKTKTQTKCLKNSTYNIWNLDDFLSPNMMIDTSPWSSCSRRSPWLPWSSHKISSTGPSVSPFRDFFILTQFKFLPSTSEFFFNVENLIDKMLQWHNIYIQRRANELGCLLLETSSILTVIKSLLLRGSMHCYVSTFFQLSLVTFTFLRSWVIGDFSFWFWKSYWDLHWASSSGCEYEIPLHSARYSYCYSILPGYHSDTWPQSAWRWWLLHHLRTCSGK